MTVKILEVQYPIGKRFPKGSDYRSRILEYESFEEYLYNMSHGYTGKPDYHYWLYTMVVNKENKEVSGTIGVFSGTGDYIEKNPYYHYAKVIEEDKV